MATPWFALHAIAPKAVDLRFGAGLRALERGIVDRVPVLRREQCPAADDLYARLASATDHDGCPMSRRA